MKGRETQKMDRFFRRYRLAVGFFALGIFFLCTVYFLLLFFVGKKGEESLLRKWCFVPAGKEEQEESNQQSEQPTEQISAAFLVEFPAFFEFM